MRLIRRFGLVLLALAALLAWPAWMLYAELDKMASEDPLVWEADIAALESEANGPPGSVLFMGSSSIRLWDTLAEDMAPLATIQRGFGGAKIGDAIHYAGRLVDVPDPAAIVIFVGTNDLTPQHAKSLDVMLASFRTLIEKIRAQHPEVPIYYIGITPSPLRWAVWPQSKDVNAAIEAESMTMPYVFYLETGDALMSGGEPDPDNYIFDGLHLSAQGYAIWTRIIRSRLLQDLNVNASG